MGTITSIDQHMRIKDHPALALGTGLIALDIVVSESIVFRSAGGSCGNVMTMLAWLGWDAGPVGRIGEDSCGDYIIEEYEFRNVNTKYLIRDKLIETPVIIQKFSESSNGKRTHCFYLTCPVCKSWLPRYRSITIAQSASILCSNLKPNLFYFDRVTPASIRLVEWARDSGAIVLFEPSSVGKDKQFQQAVDLCHVLKYSKDQIGYPQILQNSASPGLIIETLGEHGLRMKWRGEWTKLPSFPTREFKDASGSGDWCSAGFLHFVGSYCDQDFSSLKHTDIQLAIKFGQALATINCQFEGARGMMNNMSFENVDKAIESVLNNDNDVKVSVDKHFVNMSPAFRCKNCGHAYSKGAKELTVAA